MSFPYIPAVTVEVPEIDYKPQLALPAAKSALIIVDMQNDFVTAGGKLVVPAAADTVTQYPTSFDKGAHGRRSYCLHTGYPL